jgi:hypothetical protein
MDKLELFEEGMSETIRVSRQLKNLTRIFDINKVESFKKEVNKSNIR